MSLLRFYPMILSPRNLQIAGQQTRAIQRWVGPTLRELRVRKKKLGPQPPEPRSSFIEWNYRAEIFAFGKRLQEEFELPLLQTAFTQRSYALREHHRQTQLGIEDANIAITDNRALSEQGNLLTKEYVQAYLKHSLPKVPAEGQKAILDYLTSTSTLAHVASNLGMKELIFSEEYPPHEESLANSLLAVIGALEESSTTERAFLFIRDFICTQLNQRDLLELWNIEDPEAMLKEVCKSREMAEPEPRLLGECGKNTILAAYHVGIYSNKKMIGSGFGEDVQTAIKTASLDALQVLFDIKDNRRPFDFSINVESKTEAKQIEHN